MSTGIILAIITLVLGIGGACIMTYIVPSIERKNILKAFEELELNSKWITKTNDTNPFKKHHEVMIVTKEMGTDGKTPWIIYERTSGFRDTIKLEDFLRLYTRA